VAVRVRELSSAGILKPDPSQPLRNVVFLGRVFAQNPARIAEWMKRWKDLSAAEKEVLRHAVWRSDIAQGRAWLEENGLKELAAKPVPDLLKGPRIITPEILDAYWEWFFATGERAPIENIVSVFDLAQQFPADGANRAGLPKPSADLSREDQRQWVGYLAFRTAVWSTISIAKDHPVLRDHLKRIEAEQAAAMHPKQHAWLKHVIALAEKQELKPKATQAGPTPLDQSRQAASPDPRRKRDLRRELLGASLEDAKRTDLFAWFRFRETGREKDDQQRSVVVFEQARPLLIGGV
jgi:hypothetical protein